MTLAVHERAKDGVLVVAEDPQAALVSGTAVWIDLLSPSAAEEAMLEAVMDSDVPTHQERRALEDSARFYEEGGALVLVPTVMARDAEGNSRRDAVAFVLNRRRLITVRDCTPRAFLVGAGRSSARISAAASGQDVMMALLESLVERIADLILETGAAVDSVSKSTLEGGRSVRLEPALKRLGQFGVTASQCRDSLASIARMARFAASVADRHALDRAALGNLADDVATLQRQAESLMADLTFLLDATLGLAGARQNETLKVMAVVTLLFVPPTLIASVFGMNFESFDVFLHPLGHWLALGLMIASSAIIITIARWGRWI